MASNQFGFGPALIQLDMQPTIGIWLKLRLLRLQQKPGGSDLQESFHIIA
jgi:hypothetical protein